MRNYRLKFKRPKWKSFFVSCIVMTIFFLIFLFFDHKLNEFIIFETFFIILYYFGYGKYPYWMTRKKEVAYDKY